MRFVQQALVAFVLLYAMLVVGLQHIHHLEFASQCRRGRCQMRNRLPQTGILDDFDTNGHRYLVSYPGRTPLPAQEQNFTKVQDAAGHLYFYQPSLESGPADVPFHDLVVASFLPRDVSDADILRFVAYYLRQEVKLFTFYYNGHLNYRQLPEGLPGVNYFQWPYPLRDAHGSPVAVPGFEVSLTKQLLFDIQRLVVCNLTDFFYHPTLTLRAYCATLGPRPVYSLPSTPVLDLGRGVMMGLSNLTAAGNPVRNIYSSRHREIVNFAAPQMDVVQRPKQHLPTFLSIYNPNVDYAVARENNFVFGKLFKSTGICLLLALFLVSLYVNTINEEEELPEIVLCIDKKLQGLRLAKVHLWTSDSAETCSLPCRYGAGQASRVCDAVVYAHHQKAPVRGRAAEPLKIVFVAEAKLAQEFGRVAVPTYDISSTFDHRATVRMTYAHEPVARFGPEKFFDAGGRVEDWLLDDVQYPGVCAFGSSSCGLNRRDKTLTALARYLPVYQFGTCPRSGRPMHMPDPTEAMLQEILRHESAPRNQRREPHFANVTNRKFGLPAAVFAEASISRERQPALLKRHALSKCWFYAAFENTDMDEYVTEKFFEAFQIPAPTVTIYLGTPSVKTDYGEYGFLHLADFRSADDLGRTLQQFDFVGHWESWRMEQLGRVKVAINREHDEALRTLPCRWCEAVYRVKSARKELHARISLPDVHLTPRHLANVTDKTLWALWQVGYDSYWAK